MNSGSKVLLSVLAGAAAGAIIGILFAPDKGYETRRRIAEGSKDVTDNLKTKFSDLVDNIADKYESAKEGAADLIEKGKQKIGVATNAVSNAANNAANTAANTANP